MFARCLLVLWLAASLRAETKDAGDGKASGLVITNKVVETTIRRSDYTVRAWTREQGLPNGWVNSIAQTADGYLWLATMNGLARFDGVRFVVFDSGNTAGLKSSRIMRVYADRKSRLWILSEFGDVAYHEGRDFKSCGLSEGVPANGFRAFGETASGELWAGARFQEGCFRFQDGRFVQPNGRRDFELGTIHTMALEGDGSLWAMQARGQGESVTPVRLSAEHHAPLLIRHGGAVLRTVWMCESRDGGLWILTRLGLHHYRKGQCDRLYRMATDEELRLNELWDPLGMVEDTRGGVWVAAREKGLLRFDLKGTVQRFFFGATDDLRDARAVFQDREENIWVGLRGGGLRLFRPRIFTTFGTEDGLAADEVRSVCEDPDGNILVANHNRLYEIQEGKVTQRLGPDSFPSVAQAVISAPDRSIWLATFSAGLIHCVEGKIKQYLAPFQNRFYGPRAWSVYLKSNGEIYLGARDGLYSIRGDLLQEIGRLADLDEYDIRAITEDQNGNLYLGLNANGLLIQRGDHWSRLTKTNGLPSRDVWSLHMDKEQVLWGGTINGGLFRLKKERVFSLNDTAPELPRVVNSILEDDAGFLWLSSDQGIFRVQKQQLNDVAEGKQSSPMVTRYGIHDGLESIESQTGYQPMACKARDGRLWFATMKGVSVVNPKQLPHNPVAPQVWIEEVRLDGKSAMTPSNGTVLIPPKTRHVEIQYTATSFSAPEKVRFRYKVKESDTYWTDMGGRRTAYFEGLGHGDYRFQVAACNDDGIWNETGAALALVVQPLFWQTTPFRVAMASAAGGLLFLFYRLRIARLERRQLAQQEFSRKLIDSQEQERKRIAIELHDSLGQKLQLIRNHAALALNRGKPSENESGPLGRISNITSDAIAEVRAITAALRPAELDQIGLTGALRWMIENVSTASGTRFLSEIDPIDGLLSPENEMNVYRIIQESLNNIIKHAQATEVTVEIHHRDSELSLSIFDNGRGFDPSAAAHAQRAGAGLGLAGMRERVRILGGTHAIDTKPGGGTRLMVKIPVSSSSRA